MTGIDGAARGLRGTRPESAVSASASACLQQTTDNFYMMTQSIIDTDVKGVADERVRQFWRCFGTTLTLVATEVSGTRYAMLATSVVSVSFAPAALAVCLNKSASSYMPLLSRGAFSLAIFPQSAKSIAEHIAAADSSHRFDKGSWTRLEAQGSAMHGLPLLKEAGGTLLCRVDSRMDYGTHSIIIARINDVVGNLDDRPLLYGDRGYGRFGAVS